jgi:quercetin dioxygenase-like cupin family protein
VIDIAAQAGAPEPGSRTRVVLGPDVTGTRTRLAIVDLDDGGTWRTPEAPHTQVIYILDGTGATLSHTSRGATDQRPADRRSGVYLEPGETVAIAAGGGPLVLLHVTVPKYAGRTLEAPSPVGYVFEEARLRSLVDEQGIRERTFWVNTETGLSGSWDLQIGRMRYAPRGHSPRHVHRPSPTSTVTPEHFYLIERGTGDVQHDAGALPVGPGHLVLIPSGEWHQLVASDSGFDYIECQAPFDFATTMDHDPLGKHWYIKGTDDGTGRPRLWVQS